MSAHRQITPRVLRWLAGALPCLPAKRRVSYPVAALVLNQCARWARQEDDRGRWRINDTLEQIATSACLPRDLTQRALLNLESVNLVVTITRGGGASFDRRGSVRHLLLDPSEGRPDGPVQGTLALDGPPAFNPQLVGVSPNELTPEQACGLLALQRELVGVSPNELPPQLVGVEGGTRGGTARTRGGPPQHSVLTSVVDTPLLPPSSTDDESSDGIPDWLVGKWADRLPPPKVST